LARKYEDKYKQVGGVASKLTLEEATFRDIQVFSCITLEKVLVMKVVTILSFSCNWLFVYFLSGYNASDLCL